MRLIRTGERGSERPGVQLPGGERLDASGVTRDYDEAFFDNGGLDELGRWLARDQATAPRLDRRARTGSPIARPSKIICVGLNFRDHAAETGADLPVEPIIFLKSTTAIVGPDDDVMVPRESTKLDWEVELAVVVGRTARHVPKDRALSYVAGYMLHNDYSERAFQLERGGQWVKGKSADTFAPLGPFLATTDEILNADSLNMWLTVNGQTRQRSTTANMIFDVPALVSYISDFMTLLPGDVISTGTPAGVGLGMKPSPAYLAPGDIVELGIDGLGQARQRIVAYNGT